MGNFTLLAAASVAFLAIGYAATSGIEQAAFDAVQRDAMANRSQPYK